MRSLKESYTQESITSLKPVEAIRFRPGVMLGSSDINGCIHAAFEILSNSVDEARAGFGDTINFTIHADNSITVEDFGRGIPLDWNKKVMVERYE
jgi:DNA gyrase subunit B